MSVVIGPFGAADWEQVRAIYADGIAGREATFETEVPDWPEWDAARLPTPRLAAWDGTTMLGWAVLSSVSRRQVYAGVAEVSVYVGSGHRGRGVGRLLLEAMISASERLGFWTLQGATFPENVASLKLQESCGFRVVGRCERIAQLDGVWRDTVLTERRSRIIGVKGPE
jgi:phosphinothricin acetyltransferase